MGFFSSKSSGEGQGRSSADGGNGNVRDTRAEHNHRAIETPNLAAVRALSAGTRDYEGKHRAS